ncbi:YbaB/EbfC family nucleoid-associated protein [Nocardia arthritidis]|uniref:Nucleoid-associated protein F5544_01560 n=1 Tax=Nocardia arthritidis TaxID=228602 RepID=A0A6G9Y507_9NOCA|nr:YbaB/EbfC family nucleoid-associated protein [Nocardia arthritidis]
MITGSGRKIGEVLWRRADRGRYPAEGYASASHRSSARRRLTTASPTAPIRLVREPNTCSAPVGADIAMRGRAVQPGGQFDMQQLLAQAQQMQQAVLAAQAEIAAAEVEGQAGNGLVKVTIKATGEVVSLTIDPKVVDPEDVESLQDLVIGAINDAMANAQQVAADRLGPLAGGGLGGSLPGLPDF